MHIRILSCVREVNQSTRTMASYHHMSLVTHDFSHVTVLVEMVLVLALFVTHAALVKPADLRTEDRHSSILCVAVLSWFPNHCTALIRGLMYKRYVLAKTRIPISTFTFRWSKSEKRLLHVSRFRRDVNDCAC